MFRSLWCELYHHQRLCLLILDKNLRLWKWSQIQYFAQKHTILMKFTILIILEWKNIFSFCSSQQIGMFGTGSNSTALMGKSSHLESWPHWPLISFRVLAYTRDIPGIYQCFKIYQRYLWLSQVIPWIYQIHIGISHTWSALVRDIHVLTCSVWDIPNLVWTNQRYP